MPCGVRTWLFWAEGAGTVPWLAEARPAGPGGMALRDRGAWGASQEPPLCGTLSDARAEPAQRRWQLA